MSNGLTAQRMLSTGLFAWAHYNLDPIFILNWGVECIDPKEKQQICNVLREKFQIAKYPACQSPVFTNAKLSKSYRLNRTTYCTIE